MNAKHSAISREPIIAKYSTHAIKGHELTQAENKRSFSLGKRTTIKVGYEKTFSLQ